jgi:hypothetical protein
VPIVTSTVVRFDRTTPTSDSYKPLVGLAPPRKLMALMSSRSSLVAFCIVLAACGKQKVISSDGGTATTVESATARSTTDLPICEPWIVTEHALPMDWKTYPIVATSGRELVIDKRSADHYVDELLDVPVGPFVLRYWQGRTRPTTDGLTLRLVGCQSTPLQLTSLSYWNGGPVVLRMKENVFVITSGEPFEPIAVVRRLPK